MTTIALEVAAPVTTAPAVVNVEIGEICDDCAILLANDDASGMSAEREHECRIGIARTQLLPDGRYGYLVVQDPEAEGEQEFECNCCGTDALGWGYRGVILVD